MSNELIYDIIDVAVEKNNINPLYLVEYLLTQHLLREGIAGQDEYQDALNTSWTSLINAISIKKKRESLSWINDLKGRSNPLLTINSHGLTYE